MRMLKKRFQQLHILFRGHKLCSVGKRWWQRFCSTVTWIIENIISKLKVCGILWSVYEQRSYVFETFSVSASMTSWPSFACSPFRLCVAALSVNSFCGSREALYGVFDGDRNVEVPYLLQCTMNDVLAEELHKTKSEEDYMTNTFLVMQRYMIGSTGLFTFSSLDL